MMMHFVLPPPLLIDWNCLGLYGKARELNKLFEIQWSLLVFKVPLLESLHGLNKQVWGVDRSSLHELVAALLHEVLLDDVSFWEVLISLVWQLWLLRVGAWWSLMDSRLSLYLRLTLKAWLSLWTSSKCFAYRAFSIINLPISEEVSKFRQHAFLCFLLFPQLLFLLLLLLLSQLLSSFLRLFLLSLLLNLFLLNLSLLLFFLLLLPFEFGLSHQSFILLSLLFLFPFTNLCFLLLLLLQFSQSLFFKLFSEIGDFLLLLDPNLLLLLQLFLSFPHKTFLLSSILLWFLFPLFL